mmetsp:Transcript_31274/g.78359  ORF Transcript_31274/g.78359 Transcript_31274/m.78359 type:complete len:923 (-) Transcript_31274:37-2805(-)
MAQHMEEDDTLLRKAFFEVLKHHHPEVANKVDIIFALSQSWTNSPDRDKMHKELKMLEDYLVDLDPEEMILVASSFSQLLNLHNISEAVHLTNVARASRDEVEHSTRTTNESMKRLINDHGIKPEDIYKALCSQTVDLVMTAHPTQALRRSVLKKYNMISKELDKLHSIRSSAFERSETLARITSLVQAAWRTDEIRRSKPTPQDEMKNGLSYFEETIFDALPKFLRRLDSQLASIGCPPLPLEHSLFKFGSWMGGDRDGNPNVTPEVTRDVVILSRLAAVNIYFEVVNNMMFELSLWRCSDALKEEVLAIKAKDASGDYLVSGERKTRAYAEFWSPIPATEPYRVILGVIRDKLYHTREVLHQCLADPQENLMLRLNSGECFSSAQELLTPLKLMYHSLKDTGDGHVADDHLLDFIRQVQAFGMSFVQLDIRQESTRHSEVMARVTEYLGMGNYLEWDEPTRLEFLEKEMNSKRPLMPPGMQFSKDEEDVVNTFRVLASLPADSLGAYVISMARTASDVLCVKVLMRECGVTHFNMRVAPLFETLDDLEAAGKVMDRLLRVPIYRKQLEMVHGNHQEIMLGYSDSGKDAGRLAANWALYQCQEQIVAVCNAHSVKTTLFHGRGGTVGRGGGPLHLAMQSQPAGSVKGTLRVTEQGEMIQAKFGLVSVAAYQLEQYTHSVLNATLDPPAPPASEKWVELIGKLAEISCNAYRGVVFKNPYFIKYFRDATPEEELGNLNIGSRPSRRKKGGGVETLRAIPWIFAWTQTRMVLPAWLGIGEAFQWAIGNGYGKTLREMYEKWPFFQSTIDLIEMILAKADMRIAKVYDEVLVHGDEYKDLGEDLREKLQTTMNTVLHVSSHHRLCDNNPKLRRLIEMRNPFIDPINILQVEILRRLRAEPENSGLRDALMVTINGISAGMRNTG